MYHIYTSTHAYVYMYINVYMYKDYIETFQCHEKKKKERMCFFNDKRYLNSNTDCKTK